MRRLFLLAAMLAVSSPGRAWSTEPDVAEQLFREGHALLKEQRYAEACPKFAESQRQDPASGTLLALAYCEELANHLASAQVSYVAAAELARTEKQEERRRVATERAEALSARLSSLTINLPATLRDLPSLSVTSNGVELARATWGRPMPSDGGNYAIQISAAGRTYWSTQVLLGTERDQRVLDVPLLPAPEPAASKASVPSAALAQPRTSAAPERRYWTTPRTVGWSVIGAGAATGVASLYFALAAKSAERDVENALRSEENQPGPPSSRTPWDSAGHGRELDGERAQALAQGFGFASGALLIGGAALVIFGSDKSEPAPPRVSMELAPGFAKIDYAKRF